METKSARNAVMGKARRRSDLGSHRLCEIGAIAILVPSSAYGTHSPCFGFGNDTKIQQSSTYSSNSGGTHMETTRLFNRTAAEFKLVSFVIATVFFHCIAIAANDEQPCAHNSQTRQLDYWLGNWTMGSGEDRSTSRVSLSLDKCVFVEHWENGKGHVAEKMFAYTPEENNWYGMFADNQGRVHVFLDGKITSDVAELHG